MRTIDMAIYEECDRLLYDLTGDKQHPPYHQLTVLSIVGDINRVGNMSSARVQCLLCLSFRVGT